MRHSLFNFRPFVALSNASRPSPAATERWLVLHQGENPSTDYYIRPYLRQTGLPVSYRHLDADLPQKEDFTPGTGVVIVRYLNNMWTRALREHQRFLPQVAYFADDDLLYPRNWRGLPSTYSRKLKRYCHAYRSDIRHLTTSYWFSTPTLRERYAQLPSQLILPKPLENDYRPSVGATVKPAPSLNAVSPSQTSDRIHVFYHGTAAHQAEIAWLQPIITEVLKRCPNVYFEIVGDHQTNVHFRHLPRTRILHPMTWQNYRAHCKSLDGDIGLAPLLPSAFNATRSYVKAYDIARCGAVGLYSDWGPYPHLIRDGENGLLLSNDPQTWVHTLCALVQDRTRLNRLRQAAQTMLRLEDVITSPLAVVAPTQSILIQS